MAASSSSSFATTASSRMFHHQQVMIRVLVAETGATYKISLTLSDLTVNNLRSHLAAAVPLSDQILLLGPPFKVPKDRDFQSDEILNSLRLGDMEDDPIQEESSDNNATTNTSTESTSLLKLPRRRLLGQSSSVSTAATATATAAPQQQQRAVARRLFLFSKSALSPASQIDSTPPCVLSPQTVLLPTGDVQGPSPLADALAASTITSSPLHQALVAYESQFRKYLEQGRVLADAADLRLGSCVACLQEQAVMARALQAAVSNLADHSGAASRSRSEFTALFHSKTTLHGQLLQGFESVLQQLANIPLHPALVRAAARHSTTTSTATSGTGTANALANAAAVTQQQQRHMTTLLDTVPVERERNWMQQCQTSHTRLLKLFQEVEADFQQFSSFGSDEDEHANLQLELKWEQVQGGGKALQAQQAQRLERLTASHSQVVKTILQSITSNSEAAIQGAFVPLGELSESSKGLVPDMLQADAELQRLQQIVADSKTEATQRLKRRLREISAAQSGIQKALSNLSVLRDALKQQCENMEHIEHVAELPVAYQQFLQEIQRRRAYGRAVAASSTALMERLAAMREDEVKAREKFLRGPGRHLMPAFYDVFVPSLASSPPLFAPQLPPNEIDTLPDASTTFSGAAVPLGVEGEFPSMQSAEHGVSSASSLTTSGQQSSGLQQQQQQQQQHLLQEDQEMSSGVGGAAQQHHDQLIVSASEQSDNDLYLDPATGAAAEAEARTLAYENLVLRQALERLGGKPPRSYLQEARATAVGGTSSGAAVAAASAREEKAQIEVAALRKELGETKARAEMATEALKRAASSSALDPSGLSDRISHSSFQVGDVGLFMPTGRGSGGKRTYLAFHTKCPYRFLSTDNIKGTPDFVLGRIIYQEELVAGKLGTDANPYGLPVGTKFWVLTVEVLTSQT